MKDDIEKKEILTFLGAFSAETVRAALKDFARARRENRLIEGWVIWNGEGEPERPYEWRRIGNITYYRMPPPPKERVMVSGEKPIRTEPVRNIRSSDKICPDCGAQAFVQMICPACAKGKAGIRKMYICGENSDHVFYTE